jgi:hypothetical protein
LIDVAVSGKIVDENHAESGDDDENLFDTLIVIRHLAALFIVCYSIALLLQIIILLSESSIDARKDSS